MIRPEPVISPIVNDGLISYDSSSGQFIISIREVPRPIEPNQRDLLDLPAFPDLLLSYRSRFTYAHEFGHRLLFIPAGGGWQRAIQVVAQQNGLTPQHEVVRRLSRREEEVCNQVAGDLLVPAWALHRIFSAELTTPHGFYDALRRGSRLLRVSYECLLIRLGRAIRYKDLPHTPGFCAFLATESEDKSGAGRSSWDFRLRVALIPKAVGEGQLRQVFSGLSVKFLGEDFLACLAATRVGGTAGSPLPLTLSLNLRAAKGKEPVVAKLVGWGTALSRGGERVDRNPVLLWGVLEPA